MQGTMGETFLRTKTPMCFSKSGADFVAYKMPHSKFKERAPTFNSGVGKCHCGQTFHYMSERNQDIKFRMHHKVCPKPAKGSKPFWIPKKAMTLKEVQHDMAERMRRVHEYH